MIFKKQETEKKEKDNQNKEELKSFINSKGKIIIACLSVLSIILAFSVAQTLYFNEIYYRVPNFVGLEYEKANRELGSRKIRLKNMGEVFSPVPYGCIALQDPEPDSIVKRHRNIKIWISKAPESVFVPNLIGENILDAESIVKQQGLIVEKITKIRSQDVGINKVIATSLQTDGPLNKGDKISFLISLGY